jgi:EAL domain-containing protein (putative c-di-GMP-specific phosphodiesterase class I)
LSPTAAANRPTSLKAAVVLSVAGRKMHQGLENLLQAFGFEVSFAADGEEITASLNKGPALVVLDLGAPPGDAIGYLNRLASVNPEAQTVLLGAGASQAGMGVVEFNETVAFGWLAKAWHVDDLGELEEQLRRTTPARDLTRVDLLRALDNHEFVLHYQPIFDLRRNEQELVAVEALVRWSHPDLGLLPPGAFLPLAETEGLMQRMTDHTLQLAAEQLTAWKQQGRKLPISVNIGADLLTDHEFPERLLRALTELGIDPEDLILEVAERGVMSHRPEPVTVAADLIDRGFHLVIDDFGRGSISLMQVMILRFVAIKIDECLIRQVSRRERAKQLVRGIVRLAHDLGMRVCAESVETAEVLFLLKGLGCDEAQGWYLGRPLPAAAVPFR